jgi:tRNA(fMet)-specific endonuclease VapC
MKYLLDTNVLSEPLKIQPDAIVMERLQQYQNHIVTATIVLHELYFGCYQLPPSRKEKSIKKYIDEVVVANIPMYSYNEDAAEWHARERARLQSIGQTPPFVDGQIAAIAHVNNLILVTRNITDFYSFSDLQIQCWHSSGSNKL